MSISSILVINVNTIKGDLKKHKMALHENVEYPCNQCESKFTQKSDLRRHKMSLHENVKYPCDQCESKFTQKAVSKYIRCHYMRMSSNLVINVNTKLQQKAT